MEKKTKFKLHYIHSHVKKSRLIRPSKLSLKKGKEENDLRKIVAFKAPLLKFFSPFTVLRTIGDFAYLDQTSQFEDYVRFSGLNLHFKQIKEIKSSANFMICSLDDYEEPFMNIDYLHDRLLSLNDQNCYEMACILKNSAKQHQNVNITGTKIMPNFDSLDERAFCKILNDNANEPMLVYHYKADPKLGYIIHKIGSSRTLKDITQMNDMQLFQDGPLVIPGKEYFRYMKNHMDMLFGGERNQLFVYYLQTPHGVLKVYGEMYQVSLTNETILIIVLRKSLQEPGIQSIFENGFQKGKKIIEETKLNTNDNKHIAKNMEEWDNMIKKYYAPWIFKEGNKRCGFVELEENDQ